MGQQRFYTSNAVQTTLAASLGSVSAPSTGQTVQITSNAGYPTQFPFTMLLEWGTVNQEVVTVTQAATGGGPFTYANCIRGDDGTAAPAHSNGAAVYHGVSQRDWSQIPAVYNPCDHAYGGDPYGVADSTTALQSTINAASASPAGGGVVNINGTFKISSVLTMKSNVAIVGTGLGGIGVAQINQTSTTANCFTGVDLNNTFIQGVTLNGPGSGSGRGFSSTLSVAASQESICFQNVTIQNFGSHGIYIQNPIVSTFINTVCQLNGGHGFYLWSLSSSAGTSCSLVGCYANLNTAGIGYWLQYMNYCSLNGCAADSNAQGYLIDTCGGVALNGCGAESTLASGSFDGTSFKLSNVNSTTLNGCWVLVNKAVAYWVTNTAGSVNLMGISSQGASGTTTGLKSDAGTAATLSGYFFGDTTPLALTAGTVNILNDGSTGDTSLAAGLGFQGGGHLFSGSAAPASGLGTTGDFYFRTSTSSGTRIYQKTGASTWTGLTSANL